jgi:membrane-bound serine protease (ClpP class)
MKPCYFARLLGPLVLLLALLGSFEPGVAAPAEQATGDPVYAVAINGPVTSVTAGYLRRALRVAEAANAQALIVTLSSGAGVLHEVRPLAEDLARAAVPVVVYVAPSGTQAGAPGAFLLSGAHISAMAPGTSFGSAVPLTRVDAALSEQTRNMVLDSVADQLRTWNGTRGRDTAWVDRAVREGAILTNEQAAASNPPAIDLVAVDQAELLTLLEGRVITLDGGRRVQLATLGRAPASIEPTAFESLRMALADPTVAFALLILGAMAIYLELASPGVGVFVGIGLVLLVAAGAGLVVLPLRWWAVLLLLGALVLIGAEFVVHSHGGLTVAGLALLVVGALNLVDPEQAPGAGVAPWAIGIVAAGVAGTAAVGVTLALRSRARPAALGREALVGRVAEVRQALDPRGMVFVDGALWQAISEAGDAQPGDWVRVTGVHNLQLIVRPLDVEGGGSEGPSPSEI